MKLVHDQQKLVLRERLLMKTVISIL